jgi:Zn-dependent protease
MERGMRRIWAAIARLASVRWASAAAPRWLPIASTVAIGAITGATMLSLVTGASIPGVPRIVQTIIRIVVLLFAIIIHEVAHGFVAEKRGDPTARIMGRLTLNPIPHIDLFGSIIIPGFLILTGSSFVIGWAKPVPVDIRRFRDPLRDFAVTSLAGPASNLAQLAVFVVLFRVASALVWPNWIGYLAFSGAAINLFLAVFNLIPIPPLDGSRLLAASLPPQAAVQYLSVDRFGFIIIFGLLYIGAFEPLFGVAQRLLGALLW